jgi:hypothetical protein
MVALEDWIYDHDYYARRGTQDFKIGRRILDGRPRSAHGELVCWPKRTRVAVVVFCMMVALTPASHQFKAYGTQNWVQLFLHHHDNKASPFHSPLATEVVLNELAMAAHLAPPSGWCVASPKVLQRRKGHRWRWQLHLDLANPFNHQENHRGLRFVTC